MEYSPEKQDQQTTVSNESRSTMIFYPSWKKNHAHANHKPLVSKGKKQLSLTRFLKYHNICFSASYR